jgi:hypothetical protein
MKTMNYFVYCLLLFLLGGCVCHWAEDMGQTVAELPSVSLFFYAENNRWPNSIDELKVFYSEKQYACPNIDWDKYTDATFLELSDGSLQIESGKSQEHTIHFRTILDKPKSDEKEVAR